MGMQNGNDTMYEGYKEVSLALVRLKNRTVLTLHFQRFQVVVLALLVQTVVTIMASQVSESSALPSPTTSY